jgi:hypothetical protein
MMSDTGWFSRTRALHCKAASIVLAATFVNACTSSDDAESASEADGTARRTATRRP